MSFLIVPLLFFLMQTENCKLKTATDIEHVGSTAIKGIVAKPIIDMVAGVATFADAERLHGVLARLGYQFRPNASKGRERLFVKGPESNRTHYLHVVKHGGSDWQKCIFFRDYLNEHPQAAKTYEKLKIELAKKFANDRPKYTKAKEKFIRSILKHF